jgi:transposase
MERCAGIDWASEEHALCVVGETGESVAGELFSHEESGVRALASRMRALGVCRVAIERPDGLLVDRLLEAGFTVLPVHPNKLKATRPRYEASGGKSDGFDAFALAELARTDSHRLRALRPDPDETKALRALTRTREDLVGARVRLANELRAQLDGFWPGAARIFGDIDSPIGLAFLERYPAPADARGWARSASPDSSPATATAAGARRWSCSSDCAPRPRAVPVPLRPRPAGRRCSAWSRP